MNVGAAAELGRLLADYPGLQVIKEQIRQAFVMLRKCVVNDGVIYCCGNGGSAADCEHIVGELMKGYKLQRELPAEKRQSFADHYGERGAAIAGCLQSAIRAQSLVSQTSLMSAYNNDINCEYVFAQQIYGYGREKDVLWALSTSGNSANVVNAAITAREKKIAVLAMTGAEGGELADIADVCLKVPYRETDRIQECHLAVYHCLCAMLEKQFFEN